MLGKRIRKLLCVFLFQGRLDMQGFCLCLGIIIDHVGHTGQWAAQPQHSICSKTTHDIQVMKNKKGEPKIQPT